ncbi:hypothetical protein [Flavobacterium agrisoli]|uniref:Uncharacterized protein n=1 Tax=Flavobacterium agrisoli TaxID=2793066 RepID=A0A934PMM0_9FLAO|nr:hypothetical protein [Flavobacterium agrisoli]MBK0370030.1 hypothetical protein [Flavobacterium agrisoli]
MKGFAQILLIVFVMSLTAPTIVTIIKKDYPRTISFNLSEEEQKHKDCKVLTSHNNAVTTDFLSFCLHEISKIILYENLSRHDNVAATIFSPPPNRL